MAGGTQVTTTTTQPWEKQEPLFRRGDAEYAQDLYSGGSFAPEFYGSPGTQAPGAAANIGQVAPGVAAFDPQQQQAMKRILLTTLWVQFLKLDSGAEASGLLGAEGIPGILPYAQSAMGQGFAMGLPQNQAGYAAMTPFSEDQYGGLLSGDVDETQFGDVSDVLSKRSNGSVGRRNAARNKIQDGRVSTGWWY